MNPFHLPVVRLFMSFSCTLSGGMRVVVVDCVALGGELEGGGESVPLWRTWSSLL